MTERRRSIYLLGAGASYAPCGAASPRPPLTDHLMADAGRKGFLTPERCPALWKCLAKQLDNDLLDHNSLPKVDVEGFLSSLADEFNRLRALLSNFSTSSSTDDRIYTEVNLYQTAIGEGILMLYELLGSYSRPGECYLALARRCRTSDCGILTLNYDRLLELALEVSNIPYTYAGLSRSGQGVPLAKLHGSVSWLNPVRNAIHLGGETDPLQVVRRFAWSNHFNLAEIQVRPPMTIRSLAKLPGGPYEPALIPPLGGHKDYEKIGDYADVWRCASELLADASELVIIGCSLRKEDKKLCDLLASQQQVQEVIVVSSSAHKVEARIKDLLPKSRVIKRFESFEDFCHVKYRGV